MRIAIRCSVVLILLSLCLPVRGAITANNLLLIVNKNEPKGQALAEYYAQQRHVPDGRIVALDLPTTDDISFADYESRIVGPLREAITAKHLQTDATCLVTFYGVPLRIAQRSVDPQEQAESKMLKEQIAKCVTIAQPLVEEIEKQAKQADASFAPLGVGTMDPAEALPRRAEFAVQFLVDRIRKMPQGADRLAMEQQANALSIEFRAPVQIDEPATGPASQPATPSTAPALSMQEMSQKIRDLSARRWDPASRRELRQVLRQAGVLGYMRMLEAQVEYFIPEDTQAAVDNELALLWWNYYPRIHWQPNPLNYKYATVHVNPTVMVMRLDAPTSQLVHDMIDTSIKVEAEGLKGLVVLDSRGLPPQKASGEPDPYGAYDQTIRNLGMLLRARSKLELLVDDRPTLLPPNSAKNVAVYCGWYSPIKYSPSVTSFAPGGVAAHIASYEMTTLHNPTPAWCPHLIQTGAVATFGPVSEPYLHSFPQADEFFPLLFTGKLTLAEVYWRTCPLTSWRIVMVGDPLYTPYKSNPALKVEDLPLRLQEVVNGPDVTSGS